METLDRVCARIRGRFGKHTSRCNFHQWTRVGPHADTRLMRCSSELHYVIVVEFCGRRWWRNHHPSGDTIARAISAGTVLFHKFTSYFRISRRAWRTAHAVPGCTSAISHWRVLHVAVTVLFGAGRIRIGRVWIKASRLACTFVIERICNIEYLYALCFVGASRREQRHSSGGVAMQIGF